jgi:hypothetical protein
MHSHPTDIQFLNQHGNISLFKDGFTCLERRVLKGIMDTLAESLGGYRTFVMTTKLRTSIFKVPNYDINHLIQQILLV